MGLSVSVLVLWWMTFVAEYGRDRACFAWILGTMTHGGGGMTADVAFIHEPSDS